jgi:flavin-dependent dehydrogenase
MPLLSFADGYGGMVHCDGGRASLSCCVRRERLDRLTRSAGDSAGDAVLSHILEYSPALRPILDAATQDGSWLSAGPIQPGLRRCYHQGVFVIGNAAGEAHPVVAEGISMAMQSAWLLADLLVTWQAELLGPAVRAAAVRQQIGRIYQAAWRRAFAPRLRAAAAIAQWARRPRLVAATLPLLRYCPSLLTLGARLSGKTWQINPAEARQPAGSPS